MTAFQANKFCPGLAVFLVRVSTTEHSLLVFFGYGHSLEDIMFGAAEHVIPATISRRYHALFFNVSVTLFSFGSCLIIIVAINGVKTGDYK